MDPAAEGSLGALERTKVVPARSPPVAEGNAPDAQRPTESRSRSRELAEDIDALARTFLTDDPDLARFDRALTRLAELATVDEDSVRVDPGSGRVQGELDLGDELPRARFTLDGDRARIELDSSVDGAQHPGLFLRTLTLSFESDSAGLTSSSAILQFHPDTRRPAASVLEHGVEAYAGWNANSDGTTARVRPIAMRAAEDGVAWEIGAPRMLEPHVQPWDDGASACASLSAKLRNALR
ncbi:MAG TPA: hypothetical protein VMT18_12685 [Planctomycetota bacterium]|nr:hypothetical protein [Planctomycetota bacterium]